MADLAPARAAHAARLADRVGREVVVQHEVLAALALQRVDDLLVLPGAQRRDAQRLGLAAGEQRRAVRARQDADLGHDRAHRLGVAAVDAHAGVQDGVADDVGLEVLEHALGLVGVQALSASSAIAAFLAAPTLSWRACLTPPDTPRPSARGPARPAGCAARQLRRRLGQRPRLLGRVLGQLDDRLDHRLELRVAELDRAEHDLLGQLVRLALHHQHALGGAGDDQVELEALHLLQRRVQHVGALDEADPGGRHRAEERDAGQGQRGRAADQRDDVRVVLHVVRSARWRRPGPRCGSPPGTAGGSGGRSGG